MRFGPAGGVETRLEGSHFWPREVTVDTQWFAVFAVPHVTADAGMRAIGTRWNLPVQSSMRTGIAEGLRHGFRRREQ